MSSEAPTDSHVEIAHVLFIDIVAYSKLLIDQQRELVKQLNEQVRSTEEFRAAEAAGKLIRIATGDGMALAFFTSPDAPLRCALQLSEAVRESPRFQLRMGIHSGPVEQLADVNEQSNVAGGGINTAQRVMDCGDAGHILLSLCDIARFRHAQNLSRLMLKRVKFVPARRRNQVAAATAPQSV